MPLYDLDSVGAHKRMSDFQNNTNISLVNRYAYLAVDKVANSSIKNALFMIEYGPVGKTPLTMYDERASPLLSPYQLPVETVREVLNSGNYFRFAFVRNPYSRLLSCYLDRIQRVSSVPRRQLNNILAKQGEDITDVSFEQFIRVVCAQRPAAQNSHWRVQADDILWDLIDFDHIGKFESLWEDMATVSTRLWGEVRPEMANSEVNQSPRTTGAGDRLREYYTDELVELVAKRYARDFALFGYDVELDGPLAGSAVPDRRHSRS